MTAEKIDEALAPIRARGAKAKADLAICKLEEEMASLEGQIHKMCAQKEIDFEKVTDKIDEFELRERKLTQIKKLVGELFPESK